MKPIRVEPVGISVGPTPGRPVLIFKDKTQKHILPVWLDAVDAGLVLAETNSRTRASGAYHAVLKIFSAFHLQIEKVSFDEMVGHHQYVTVRLKQGQEKAQAVRLRAAEVMSLCLKAGAQFYVTPEIIERSREVDLTFSAAQQKQELQQIFGNLEGLPDELKN